MNWTPPFLPNSTDPAALIREIEDDPLTAFVWQRSSAATKTIRDLLGKVHFKADHEPRYAPQAISIPEPVCC